MENRFQILASPVEAKNRRKQLFSKQFSFNPLGENKSVWKEFRGHHTLN